MTSLCCQYIVHLAYTTPKLLECPQYIADHSSALHLVQSTRPTPYTPTSITEITTGLIVSLSPSGPGYHHSHTTLARDFRLY